MATGGSRELVGSGPRSNYFNSSSDAAKINQVCRFVFSYFILQPLTPHLSYGAILKSQHLFFLALTCLKMIPGTLS